MNNDENDENDENKYPECDNCGLKKYPIVRSIHNGGIECKANYAMCDECWINIYIHRNTRCPPDNAECGHWLSEWMNTRLMNERLVGRVVGDVPFNRELHGIGQDIGGNMDAEREMREIIEQIERDQDIRERGLPDDFDIYSLARTSFRNGEEPYDHIQDISLLNLTDTVITTDTLICIKQHYQNVKILLLNNCHILLDNIDLRHEMCRNNNIICIELKRSRIDTFDYFNSMFPNVHYIDISYVENADISNLSVCYELFVLIVRYSNVRFDDMRLRYIRYLDTVGYIYHEETIPHYGDIFPDLVIFNHDDPQDLNIVEHVLTEEEKDIIIEYSHTDIPIVIDHIVDGVFNFDPLAMVAITTLNISSDIIAVMRLVSLGFFPSVTTLHITNMNQHEADDIMGMDFLNITTLIIDEGHITSIMFDAFFNLETFMIRNNPLRDFPPINDMESLVEIIINDCGLTMDADSDEIIPYSDDDNGIVLRLIDLTNNNVSSYEPFMSIIGNAERIQIVLIGNPIQEI
jgi:hypothetical protein